MHEGDYLIVDPACEVNEGFTRDKNDRIEVMDDCDLPLDLKLTEQIEVDDETLPYFEEDWNCPEQTENDIGVEPDFLLTLETRQSKRGSDKWKYNPYGEDFAVDGIVMDDVTDSKVLLREKIVSQDIDLVDDTETDRIDNRSEPEIKFEPKAVQLHEDELTNLQLLEWLHDLPADPKETILTIQYVDQTSIKHISHDKTEYNWIAPDGPSCVSESNLDIIHRGRSKGTSMNVFVRGVGVGLTHAKNLMIKKLAKKGELETEGKNPKKTP